MSDSNQSLWGQFCLSVFGIYSNCVLEPEHQQHFRLVIKTGTGMSSASATVNNVVSLDSLFSFVFLLLLYTSFDQLTNAERTGDTPKIIIHENRHRGAVACRSLGYQKVLVSAPLLHLSLPLRWFLHLLVDGGCGSSRVGGGSPRPPPRCWERPTW